MNPLIPILIDDQTPFNFADLRTEHFPPAFDKTIAQAKENIQRIANTKEEATLENTIEAIESFREPLDKVSGIFFNLLSANTNDELQAMAKTYSPMLSELANDLLLNAQIFSRVQKVYEKIESYNGEQKQLLDKTFKAFRRNGALLSEEQKNELREIDKRLAKLTQEFSDHVLKATNEYVLFVDSFDDIKDLPSASLEEAKSLAKQKNKENSWAFTLQSPSFAPFLQYCTNESLRKELWFAVSSRGLKAPNDNREILKEIAQLRFKRAKTLGYKDHAHFVLEERMAESPEKVNTFLQDLLKHAKPFAQSDVDELQKLKTTGDLRPWDVAFYSEKLKVSKFNLSQEELRPYFRLESVIEGAFKHAELLYGLSFKERKDIPVYHDDVRAYEVREGDRFIGYFYGDFFPRESKRGGAWMTNFLEQGTWSGKTLRPHVSIVCNFTKPTESKPSLLTHDEVRTLFHEFGHALHSLLANCHYVSLSGTNVYWDFVELPSQIMENWISEAEGLNLFAKHYETGEKIPEELVEKIKASSAFQAGWLCVRQLTFALLDMGWHSGDPSKVSDVESFESDVTKDLRFFPKETGTAISPAFSHIFAGGYSAGYYSYKWAEVLDADAFEYFKEKGLFNKEISSKFRNFILSKGSSEHPMDLYIKFRGRQPDPAALLRRDGLI
ncbi:MAG: M3 family metallopeptidase [Oligoflexia bacterium]|nr:M3 family metallopeptidase [Oligoflexia bacterium]